VASRRARSRAIAGSGPHRRIDPNVIRASGMSRASGAGCR
jgi:hypothetical protein